MKTTENDRFTLKYEKEEIEDFILKILKKHPDGLTPKEILEKLPKDIDISVVNAFLLLMVNFSRLVPVVSFRINKKKKTDYTGMLNDRLDELKDLMIDGLREDMLESITHKTA
jgi:hypothetical protein